MSGEKILIVEDESLVAQDLEQTLSRLGYEVAGIEKTGQNAVQSVEDEDPDLILMDIKLDGDMNGIEASRRIRDEFRVPIIFLTAHMDEHILHEAKKTEPFAYIKKPFSSESLRSSIEVALEKHRNLRQERQEFKERIDQFQKEKEREIEYLAYHDPLTDLPNRFFFQNVLTESLEERSREDQAAILFLDLVGFQHINDAFGHSFGDRVLSKLADSFRSAIPDNTTLARWSGDVFTIFLPGIEERNDVNRLTENLFDILSFPYEVDDNQFQIKCSVGGALFPDHGQSPEELISKADIALFESKKKDGNSLTFYSEGGKLQIQQRVQRTSQLRQSIEEEAFEPYYQPLFQTDTEAIHRVEALARWNHPDGERLTGGEFIPIAESSGLIVDLGEIILKQACQDAARWRTEQNWTPCIAVNVSTKQLLDTTFLDTLQQILDESGLPPDQLELEITETTLMKHVDRAVEILNALKRFGVSVAIDDFGTGYSSLKYLIQLPVNSIKIDRYFTSRVTKNEDMLDLIDVIHILSDRFDLNTIVEGVETESERELLAPYCDEMQGYLFSRPKSAENLIQFIKEKQLT